MLEGVIVDHIANKDFQNFGILLVSIRILQWYLSQNHKPVISLTR